MNNYSVRLASPDYLGSFSFGIDDLRMMPRVTYNASNNILKSKSTSSGYKKVTSFRSHGCEYFPSSYIDITS